MKLHILSDLHLEFSNLTVSKTDADVVVLAGDIWIGDAGIGWARETFPDKEIIYLAGNHEFYGQQRPEMLTRLRIAAQETGVHFLDNDEVIIGGVRFLGCTLWTDFELFGTDVKPLAIREARQFLNDFRLIHEGNGIFSPMDSIQLHQESLAWLQNELQRPFGGKTVVVTHHPPSEKSIVERFKESMLSACFASRLDYLFGPPADLWIHGHTHDNQDYEVMRTRVICNPRGYVRFSTGPENLDFDPALVVEI